MTTAADIVNRALQQIAAQATVTGVNPTFDGSAAGNAAGILYTPAIEMLLREQDWEFSRNEVYLTISGAAPYFPWLYSYDYPEDCMRVRQIRGPTWNLLDPQAVEWSVVIQGTIKCIVCDIPQAILIYSTSNITEDQMDPLFQEALVRYLASEFAMAIGGRPDFSKEKLGEAGQIMSSGSDKDS